MLPETFVVERKEEAYTRPSTPGTGKVIVVPSGPRKGPPAFPQKPLPKHIAASIPKPLSQPATGRTNVAPPPNAGLSSAPVVKPYIVPAAQIPKANKHWDDRKKTEGKSFRLPVPRTEETPAFRSGSGGRLSFKAGHQKRLPRV
jgi:hypothetical protein